MVNFGVRKFCHALGLPLLLRHVQPLYMFTPKVHPLGHIFIIS